LRGWLREIDDAPHAIIFPSARSQLLSRDGADYILRRAVVKATASCSSLANKSVSPHVIRHYLPTPTMSGSRMAAQDSKALWDSV